MIRAFLTILLINTLLLNCFSQLSNGSFENWDTIYDNMSQIYYENPSLWKTSNQITGFGFPSTPISRTLDAYQGNYAVEIESNTWGIDSAWPGTCGQVINAKNIDSISFHYKCDSLWGNASCVVNIFSYPNKELVMSDSISQTNKEYKLRSYRNEDFGNLNSDSLLLEFVANGMNGLYPDSIIGYSVFKIDNVKTEYISSTGNVQSNGIKIFPNPSESFVTLPDGYKLIAIYDLNGKIVTTRIYQSVVDISNLETGTYIMLLEQKSTRIRETHKFEKY